MASSILKRITRQSLVLASIALLGAGCSHGPFSRFDPVATDPVMKDPLPDAAALARNFNPDTLIYPSGQVVAFPVYYTTYESRPRMLESDLAYAAASVPVFLIDVALIPVRLITQPPVLLIGYSGAQYGRSMTVAPPLPGNLPPGDKSEVPGNREVDPSFK